MCEPDNSKKDVKGFLYNVLSFGQVGDDWLLGVIWLVIWMLDID